jgi:Terminase large subunit, T4likevirus-type, N-terminal
MLMASDLRAALDPLLLADRVGLVLDPWQARLMRDGCLADGFRALLNCSRQSGKTTISLLLALWVVLYRAPSLVLIVSPSQRQSGEAFRSFMQLYRELDDAPRLVAETTLKCELSNGSRIIALPGSEKTVRGFAGAQLILLDEAARIDDALIQALSPMLATVNGSLIALSTPFGKAGWFAETWHDDGQEWLRLCVPASECPRLSPEFLESELRTLGAVAFAEEYGCEFQDDALQMFSSDLIAAAFSDDTVKPLWG